MQNSEELSAGAQGALESEPSVIATADALLEKARQQYSNHQKTADPTILMSQLEEGGIDDAPDVVSSPDGIQSSPKMIFQGASHSTSIIK